MKSNNDLKQIPYMVLIFTHKKVSIVTNQDFVQRFCLLDNRFLNDISIILKTDMFDLFYVGLSPFFRFLPVCLSIHHKSLHAHLLVHFNCEVLKIVHVCLLSYAIGISFSSLIHLV